MNKSKKEMLTMNSKKIIKTAIGVIAVILLLVICLIAFAFAFGFKDSLIKFIPFISDDTIDAGAFEETTVKSDDTINIKVEITEPVTKAPETTAPVTEVPETTAPVTKAPETTAPVTKAPETTAPVTEVPETTAPDTKAPETTAPVTKAPETTAPVTKAPETTAPVTESPDLSQEGDVLEEILKPAQITVLQPIASGNQTASNNEAIIDYSNVADGYVMAKYLTDPGVRIKVQVTGSTVTYTYNVTPGEWTVFPLSDGNGYYTVKVFRNVADNRYTTVLSTSFNVSMNNEFAPFLRPNQYVNYENMPLTAKVSSSVIHDGASMLEKVKAVYNYVVTNISYDYDKAASVQSGYLPDLDQIISSKKGICFDYAALMTGMLRVLDVPCKLVIGYAGSEYHAWISVWSQETGWVDGAIYFNASNWQRMDPTFAASGSADIINKISYTSKYIY